MLNRVQRVTKRQFDEVMKKGRVVHSPLFLIRILELGGDIASRVAAVAPVKHAKTAVLRNSMRRKIYEGVKPILGELKPGLVMAIFAKDTALKTKSKEIHVGVKELFVKAGVLR